jgi:hypothetical protein
VNGAIESDGKKIPFSAVTFWLINVARFLRYLAV